MGVPQIVFTLLILLSALWLLHRYFWRQMGKIIEHIVKDEENDT